MVNNATYVLKGLYALLLQVKQGRCSAGSQGRTCLWRMGSWVGGLSTMYDIQACLRLVSELRNTRFLDTLSPAGLNLVTVGYRVSCPAALLPVLSWYTHGLNSFSL